MDDVNLVNAGLKLHLINFAIKIWIEIVDFFLQFV